MLGEEAGRNGSAVLRIEGRGCSGRLKGLKLRWKSRDGLQSSHTEYSYEEANFQQEIVGN